MSILRNIKNYNDILKNKKKIYDKAKSDCKAARKNYSICMAKITETGIIDETGQCVTGIFQNRIQNVRSINNFDAPMKDKCCIHHFWSELHVSEPGTPSGFTVIWQCKNFNKDKPCKETGCRLYADYLAYNNALKEYNEKSKIMKNIKNDLFMARFSVKEYFC